MTIQLQYSPTACLYTGHVMRGNWKKEISKRRAHNSSTVDNRRYRSSFGCSHKVTAELWKRCARDLPEGTTLEKFHFGLGWLKTYGTEENMCPQLGHMHDKPPDEKTFRTWSWSTVQCIADLYDDVIVWENRKQDDIGNRCLTSVDGSDFPIAEQSPFWPGWKSPKFKGPGLRYELATGCRTGYLHWTNGPYPAGAMHDLTIFRQWLKWELDEGERVEADKGYRGEPCCKTPVDEHRPERAKMLAKVIRNRHETMNKRFKHFGCMKQVFRHGIEKHAICFRAIAVIVQLSLELKEPLFEIDDYDTTTL